MITDRNKIKIKLSSSIPIITEADVETAIDNVTNSSEDRPFIYGTNLNVVNDEVVITNQTQVNVSRNTDFSEYLNKYCQLRSAFGTIFSQVFHLVSVPVPSGSYYSFETIRTMTEFDFYIDNIANVYIDLYESLSDIFVNPTTGVITYNTSHKHTVNIGTSRTDAQVSNDVNGLYYYGDTGDSAHHQVRFAQLNGSVFYRTPYAGNKIWVSAVTSYGDLKQLKVEPMFVQVKGKLMSGTRTDEQVILAKDIDSINTNESVSIPGGDLPYDIFEAQVRNEYVPNLKYGSLVEHYFDDSLVGKYYLDTLERNSKYAYTLKCISAVGLLDGEYSNGGLYRDVSFATVVSEIIGNRIPYSVSSNLSGLKIYGWLPRDTMRNNLQKLLFATNVHITKDVSGNVVFDYLTTTTDSYGISGNLIYSGGSEEYPALVTKLTLTEHSFYYADLEDEVSLYDNTADDPVSNEYIYFSNAPIYVPSLRVEGGLTIQESHVNYAKVSGNGILYGKPYTHNTIDIFRTANTGVKTNEVVTSDDTLVSIANGDNIADRLMSYYSSAKKISVDMVYRGQKCGLRYNAYNAFDELNRNVYLSSIKKIFSSFIKASCEFISGYTPSQNGNVYSTCVRLTGSGAWNKPSGVSKIRIVLIGGGNGGSSGYAGTAGSSEYEFRGGVGGDSGIPGNPGKIFVTTISNPAASYIYSCGSGGSGGSACSSHDSNNAGTNGGNTTIGSYSSANGHTPKKGYADIFSTNIYALPGEVGYKGLDGGDEDEDGQSYVAEDETTVISAGGKAGKADEFDTTYFKTTIRSSGGGGGGASYSVVGSNGVDGRHEQSFYVTPTAEETYFFEEDFCYGGAGGNGSSPAKRSTRSGYGHGGAGGHGGGGGGAGGRTEAYSIQSQINYYEMQLLSVWGGGEAFNGSNGLGGYGGAGGDGAPGCILIYY